ncbi:MAG: beta-lactamase family protein, partial [Oricola sp.]|nr:beta-lactamase family protein [Oricola sp.]
MGKWLAVLFVLAAASLPASAKDGASNGAPTGLTPFVPLSLEQSHLEELDDALNQAMLSGDFVGLAVAVVRDGETKFLKTYGVTEIGGDQPITPNTRFRIASLSKGFASSLAGLAVSEGKLSLDAPAIDFAPA